jgi:hypothetical protein
VRQLARFAPIAAGFVLIVAALGKWLGWQPLLPLGVLAILAAGLAAFVLIARRARAATDATAARIDADAQLGGELRSAHWFAAQADHSPWPTFHLQRAAARVGSVSWRNVYPPVRANRAWAFTALLGIAAVTLTLKVPTAQPARATNAADTLAAAAAKAGIELPPDVAKRLQELLANADAGKLLPQDAKKLAELNDILKKLDPNASPDLAELMKKLQAAADAAKDAKTGDDLAKAAGTEEEFKAAMDDLASKLGEKPGEGKPDDAAKASPNASEDQFGKSQAQSKTGQQGKVQMSMQLVKEAQAEQNDAQPMMQGGAQGGDSAAGKGNGNQLSKKGAGDLLKAETLKRELVEASADTKGQNITKEDLRRKTEQGKSTLSFTHAAAQTTVDRSKAAPPPPVPDSRKALVQSYFIRKQ